MSSRVFGVLRWVVIAVLVLVTAFPFFYMLLLSVTPISALLQDPGRLWPEQIDLDAYREVLRPVSDGGQGFPSLMLNSLLVALATVLFTLLFSVLGAYALARIPFSGRNWLGVAFLAVYLFPAVVLAGPLYIAFARLGLTSSLAGLVFVYIALTVPVSVHMLRGHFRSVPVSIEEAAAIDGCGRWSMLWRITLPLSVPAIMSTGLYIFMIAWNEFLFALLFLTGDRDNWTVSLGLSQLTSGVEVPKTVLMAGSVLLTVPIVALYGIAERTLAEGATAGAVKG
ncbi:carbohydrate ABC transporter permease [Kineosporia rhizophila]|uniref:carbohydrate ABC transporter permease n=1 Tax=Kineosporia TaxID=49184 RepID=UPI000A74D63D|nr:MULTISPECIES: carbohydrate ABC transporter permease [Kineosporia]MCE0535124.1 carbohydrate ABC transporter permease [Kineosporia rhizophila]GLY14589.1 transporter [Kineosporia sp. NBRC 101677]